MVDIDYPIAVLAIDGVKRASYLGLCGVQLMNSSFAQ